MDRSNLRGLRIEGADSHSRANSTWACTVVQLGHAHWAIENQAFSELVTRCHADHAYRHEPTALLVLTLLAKLRLNMFLTFYRRDLKPAARQGASRLHIAQQVISESYVTSHAQTPRAPPGFTTPSAITAPP